MKQFRRVLNIVLSLATALAPLKSSANQMNEDLIAIKEAYERATGETANRVAVTPQDINGVTIYHASIERCQSDDACVEVYRFMYREGYASQVVDGQSISVRTLDRVYDIPVAVSNSTTQAPPKPKTQVQAPKPKRIDYIAGYTTSGPSVDRNSFQGSIQMRLSPPAEIRTEFQKALPAVAEALNDGYQDLKRSMATSQAMYSAHQQNLASLSRFAQIMETQRQNVEKISAINESMAAIALANMSRQINTSNLSADQLAEMAQFQAIKQNPFTYRQYELTDLAEQELYAKAEAAITNGDLRSLVKHAEIGLSQTDENKRKSFQSRFKDVIYDGLVQSEVLNPRAGPSPLDKRTFAISAQTPAGQALRRVGNLGQTLWSEQNGFKYSTNQSQATYVAALVSLSSAENAFKNGDTEEGYSALKVADSLFQGSVGFTKGVYNAAKDAVTAIPMLGKAIASLGAALVDDPSAVAEKAADLIMSTPEITKAVAKEILSYGPKFLEGDAETRGEIIGRVSGEVLLMYVTAGAGQVAMKSARGIGAAIKITSQAERVAEIVRPTTVFGQALLEKAILLEPKVAEAIVSIQKVILPGKDAIAKYNKISDAFSRVEYFTIKSLPEVIQNRKLLVTIRDGYNSEVSKIGEFAQRALNSGKSLEEVAKDSHGLRRTIGEKYKNITPENIRNEIYGRNVDKYMGDPLGPKFDDMVKRGLKKGDNLEKIYNDIILSAQRTDESLNELINVLRAELP